MGKDLNTIVSERYIELAERLQDCERNIEGKSDDDLLQDAALQTLRFFKGKKADEQEIKAYLEKIFLMSTTFKNKKVVSGKCYIEDMAGFSETH